MYGILKLVRPLKMKRKFNLYFNRDFPVFFHKIMAEKFCEDEFSNKTLASSKV